MAGCLNDPREKGTSGLWHDEQLAPKCLAGARWQRAHLADDGWRTVQVVPTAWHDVHVPGLWLAGRL